MRPVCSGGTRVSRQEQPDVVTVRRWGSCLGRKHRAACSTLSAQQLSAQQVYSFAGSVASRSVTCRARHLR